MRVAIISNGNAFSTLMLRPVFETEGIDVVGALLVRVPGSGAGEQRSAVRRLAGLVRTTGIFYSSYKFATLVIPALVRLRGARPFLNDVCDDHGVPHRLVTSANTQASLAFLRSLDAEVLISVSVPERFDPPVLRTPSMAAINIHWAALPAYAGVAPYFWVLRNGEHQTGLTVHVMEPTLDTGPVLRRRAVAIERFESVLALQLRLAQAGAEELVSAVTDLPESLATAEEQDLTGRSYFTWPTRADIGALHRRGHRLATVRDLRALARAIRRTERSGGGDTAV